MAASLVHGDDFAHVLTYTTKGGTVLNIVQSHITNFQAHGGNTLFVTDINGRHKLEFDSTQDRDNAEVLVRRAVRSSQGELNVFERMLSGSLYTANAIDLSVAPEGSLTTYIQVPAGTELYLFVSLTHGGDVIESFYEMPTVSDAGSSQRLLAKSTGFELSPNSTFTAGPTITDSGTLGGQQLHKGDRDASVSFSNGNPPDFILSEGSYLLQGTNKSGFFIAIQRKMKFYERSL